MSQAKNGDTVRVHFTGKLDDGTVFGSTEENQPLEFTIGNEKVIPGFERAVEGMNIGESKTVTLDSDQAFGARRDELVLDINKSELPDHISPTVGQQLRMERSDGDQVDVRVTNVGPETVTLDANHPLAGENLTFDMKLVEIL